MLHESMSIFQINYGNKMMLLIILSKYFYNMYVAPYIPWCNIPFILVLVCRMLIYVHAKSQNDIVISYFTHKQVTSVVGITCDNLSGDIILIRDCNKYSMSASNHNLSVKLNIYSLTKTFYWKIGIFIDTRCYSPSEIISLFDEATEYRIFDELRSWLILGDNLNDVLSVVNDKAFGISTDFVVVVPSDLEGYEFYDVYNVFKERGSILNVTYYGDWQWNTGLRVRLTQSKFRRRSNLHGLVIKAMFYKSKFKAPDIPLQEYYEDFAHRTIDGQSKFAFHVLSHLSNTYNFSLDAQESPMWEKGDKMGPIVRAIINRSIDMTGTPVGITHPRLKVIKFVHQDWPFRTCFVFRNPQPTNIKVGEILRPLADEVWYLMGFFMPCTVTVLLIIMRQDFFESDMVIFSNAFLLVIGSLCQQCTDLKMTRISTRIVFFFIMIFSLLMFNCYSASVVSARLDEPILKINDSLIELGKLNMKMASEDMVYFEFFLKKPDWEAEVFYENYWKPTVPDREWYIEPEIGMRLVQKGGFAYHTHPEIAYILIEKLFDHREVCELMEVNLGGPFYTSFGFHLNSTVVDIGRIGMLRIAETGLRIRQVNRWQYRKPRCRKDVLSADSITIYEFAPHLILLAIGAVIAVVVFAFEIYINKHAYLQVRARVSVIVEILRSYGKIEIADSFHG